MYVIDFENTDKWYDLDVLGITNHAGIIYMVEEWAEKHKCEFDFSSGEHDQPDSVGTLQDHQIYGLMTCQYFRLYFGSEVHGKEFESLFSVVSQD